MFVITSCAPPFLLNQNLRRYRLSIFLCKDYNIVIVVIVTSATFQRFVIFQKDQTKGSLHWYTIFGVLKSPRAVGQVRMRIKIREILGARYKDDFLHVWLSASEQLTLSGKKTESAYLRVEMVHATDEAEESQVAGCCRFAKV